MFNWNIKLDIKFWIEFDLNLKKDPVFFSLETYFNYLI